MWENKPRVLLLEHSVIIIITVKHFLISSLREFQRWQRCTLHPLRVGKQKCKGTEPERSISDLEMKDWLLALNYLTALTLTLVLCNFSPVAVVMKSVVASKCNQRSKTNGIREKHLSCGVKPYLFVN